MVFPILPANTESAAYEIDNSLRFNDGDSPSLQFTPSSDSNEQTWTVSFWVKRGVIGTSSSQMIFASDTNYDEYVFCRFCGTEVTNKADMFQVFMVEPNAREGNVRTSRLFRDPSAWYHIVVRCDLTQSTAADRLRIYFNGVKETSFDTASYLNQNDDNVNWNSNVPQAIGHQKQASSVERHLDGYLSEFYNIDGTSLGPDSFGETNDNGVWVPKQYTGSFGTNGYFLEFKQTGTSANSSGMGADTSGNDHHWTPANLAATDVTTDTPTNNFCTMNPLMSFAGASDGIDAFSEGNTVVDSNNDTSAAGATFGVQNGKWYYEAKLTTGNQSSTNFSTGWCQVDYEGQKGTGNGVGFMSGEDNASTDVGGNIIWNNSGNGNQATFGNRSTNDIFQVALDLDNHKMWFGVNGTWSNGNASQSTTFNANSPDFSDIFDTGGVYYMPAFAQGSTGQTVLAYNFGNPSFAISSGNADANGYGNFEYAVPSGFYSLCTKNLAEYG